MSSSNPSSTDNIGYLMGVFFNFQAPSDDRFTPIASVNLPPLGTVSQSHLPLSIDCNSNNQKKSRASEKSAPTPIIQPDTQPQVKLTTPKKFKFIEYKPKKLNNNQRHSPS